MLTNTSTSQQRAALHNQQKYIIFHILYLLISSSKAFNAPKIKATNTFLSAMSKESILQSSTEHTTKYLQYANSFSGTYGLLLENTNTNTYTPAPISLLPNVIPSNNFEQGVSICKDINMLMNTISQDYKFIYDSLSGVDEAFTGKLLNFFHKIYMSEQDEEELRAKCNAARHADSLGIFRSDYMLTPINNENEYTLKQIECNTIASSFAGLSGQISKFHQFLCARFKDDWLHNFLRYNRDTIMGQKVGDGKLGYIPDNDTIQNVAFSMNVAHERYIERYKCNNKDVIVLFVVQENETNTIDQRILEYTLHNNHNIEVVRMSLLEAYDTLQSSPDGSLFYKDKEISIIYYRAGYTPNDYPTDKHWDARLFLELNKCIKCPNLPYHLSGTKKIQQLISKPTILSKFVKDEAKQAHILSVFANLYTLNEEDATDRDKDAVLDAMTEAGCKNYVLKPQREGGGNNYYNQEMVELLKSYTTVENDRVTLSSKLKEYILMERLFPPKQLSVLLRNGKIEGDGDMCKDSISELGIFGMIVCDNSKQIGTILYNEYGGYLLRTKYFNVDEGGVASGFATLSTPFLCD